MPDFIILYVDKPQESGLFYGALLGREPVESSPPSCCSCSTTD